MNPSPVLLSSTQASTTFSQRRVNTAMTVEHAHLQRLITHPDLAWFDYLLIATSTPGAALLPPSADETEQIVAQLIGQHSTLWQLGTEALAALLQLTPQGLFSAAKTTLIVCDWLMGSNPVASWAAFADRTPRVLFQRPQLSRTPADHSGGQRGLQPGCLIRRPSLRGATAFFILIGAVPLTILLILSR